jgi:hypothetical protein
MPANLSEGVLWQRCSNCGGVCCEDARRRGEERVVWGFAIELLVGVVAAFAVAEGAQVKMEGATLAHSATFT